MRTAALIDQRKVVLVQRVMVHQFPAAGRQGEESIALGIGEESLAYGHGTLLEEFVS
jgi:hypothetical protein